MHTKKEEIGFFHSSESLKCFSSDIHYSKEDQRTDAKTCGFKIEEINFQWQFAIREYFCDGGALTNTNDQRFHCLWPNGGIY